MIIVILVHNPVAVEVLRVQPAIVFSPDKPCIGAVVNVEFNAGVLSFVHKIVAVCVFRVKHAVGIGVLFETAEFYGDDFVFPAAPYIALYVFFRAVIGACV